MNSFEELLSAAGELKHNELEALSEKILEMLKLSPNECIEHIEENGERFCRRCNSKSVVKYGKDKNGVQRYKCRSCNTIFRDTSYSVVSNTKHDLSVWKAYIRLLLEGASLAKCAEACSISVQTAFVWRHKILSALQNDQNDRMLGGIIETDETYFPISYKGNHKKSTKFVMPRKAHKRGTDSRDQIGSRACVMYAMERNGQTYGEVLGKGQPTIAMLSHAFDKKIIPDSIVISDKSIGLKNYFNNKTSLELIQLLAHVKPKSMNSPPEIKGSLHIQNINNLHYRFHRFLYRYNGVSTKYLNHYVNLFVWIENHKKIAEVALEKEILNTLTLNNTYNTYNDVVSMSPIPCVA